MGEKTFAASCQVNSQAKQAAPRPTEKQARERAEREWWENIAAIRERFIKSRVEQLLKQ